MCIVTCKVCTQYNSVYAKYLRPIELNLLFLLVLPSMFKVCDTPVLIHKINVCLNIKCICIFVKKDK